jgi:hypothetical protein
MQPELKRAVIPANSTGDWRYLSLPIYHPSYTLALKRPSLLLNWLVFFGLFVGLCAPAPANGQPSKANGIQPLIQLERHLTPHQLIPQHIRPLLLPHEQEQFLQELEGIPPDWTSLQNPDHTTQSERLYQLNRERDKIRLAHTDMLQQPIAFLWSGILRHYLSDFEGFSVALGPELTSTSWGIVRFKPVGLPDYLVAIPARELSRQILTRQETGQQIEIGVLFWGTLTTDESLIYDFSHDDKENTGMILPVVHIEGVRYFLNTTSATFDQFPS